MTIPDWWVFVLLVLAAHRTFVLVSEDKILDRPRRWALRLGDWQAGSPPQGYRHRLGAWLSCPWCCGFWSVVVWWGLWQIWPHGVLVAAGLFAASSALAAVSVWFESK